MNYITRKVLPAIAELKVLRAKSFDCEQCLHSGGIQKKVFLRITTLAHLVGQEERTGDCYGDGISSEPLPRKDVY